MHTSDELISVKESFLVILDSRNGDILNGSFNSQVIFNFEGSLYFQVNDYIQLSFSVNSFSVPNSIYIINETNNLLSISILGITTDYYISYGNYNIDTFKTYLLNILPSTFSISYNKINYKYTITNSTNDFIINTKSTINEIMGFSKSSYSSNLKSITLPFPCNFNGLQNINISLENVNTNNLDSFSKTQSNIIQSIPVDVNSSMIRYTKSNDIMIPIKVNFLDSINISLLDDKNNTLNLNNQHFNLTLQFTVIKDINRFKHSFTHILENEYFEN